MIIPIGIQCLNATLKKNINKDTKTLPFDWMLSHPKFVYKILKLLLENKINIEEIVNNHFFYCDKRATYEVIEAYYTHSNGFALYNSKYDVIFPHDKNDEETKMKYIRRLSRLKDLILNSNEKLVFIYSSQSSLKSGNFTIDERVIIKNVYSYLTKIYDLINMYNNNNEMIVFDSILNEDKNKLNEKITLYEMNTCNDWSSLLTQILKKNIIID
tara:strand:+ start:4594 stop:5235 length:642 start_codon:yes stop_codon:yes gene_type:complete